MEKQISKFPVEKEDFTPPVQKRDSLIDEGDFKPENNEKYDNSNFWIFIAITSSLVAIVICVSTIFWYSRKKFQSENKRLKSENQRMSKKFEYSPGIF